MNTFANTPVHPNTTSKCARKLFYNRIGCPDFLKTPRTLSKYSMWRKRVAEQPALYRPLFAVASEVQPGACHIESLIREGQLKKSDLRSLRIGDLRKKLSEIGLPTEGLKNDLVLRLFEWYELTKAPSAPSAIEPQQSATQWSPSRAYNPASDVLPLTEPAIDHMSVTWLGTSSGAPSRRRNVSGTVVHLNDTSTAMVDVGEGSRNQMRLVKINPLRISHLLITHLHGDHCFGLLGMISEISTLRRGTDLEKEPIIVCGPPELHLLFLGAYKAGSLSLTTPIQVHGFVIDAAKAFPLRNVDPSGMLQFSVIPPKYPLSGPLAAEVQQRYGKGTDGRRVVVKGAVWSVPQSDSRVKITAAQLKHRLPCWGYIFEEPTHLLVHNGRGEGNEWRALKGGTIEKAIEKLGSEAIARPGRKLVILGDTADSRAIGPPAFGADLLSHEATYNVDMAEKARIAGHSTSEQAGSFAGAIRAKTLVLTHFSARYDSYGSHRSSGTTDTRRSRPKSDTEILISEAKSGGAKCRVLAANDLFTFNVSPREHMTLADVAEDQAAERRALKEAAAMAAPLVVDHQKHYNSDDYASGEEDNGYDVEMPGAKIGQQLYKAKVRRSRPQPGGRRRP